MTDEELIENSNRVMLKAINNFCKILRLEMHIRSSFDKEAVRSMLRILHDACDSYKKLFGSLDDDIAVTVSVVEKEVELYLSGKLKHIS